MASTSVLRIDPHAHQQQPHYHHHHPSALPTPTSPTTATSLPFRIPHPQRVPSSSALRIDTLVTSHPTQHRLPTPNTPQRARQARAPYPFYTPKHLQHSSSPLSPAAQSPVSATSLRSPADPYADVTRLRVRAARHPCLYPGAMYAGTQKSGKVSYDVAVTIVNVDLAASHLCGYLRIRGLTEDYPELTTYFDAQLVGPRHGFRSPAEYAASAAHDAEHWSRFPAFRRLHPAGTVDTPREAVDEGGVVFMRWKEKFLVPDHRVKDINGASFAGFYYVCVEFDPPPTSSSTSGSPSPRSARPRRRSSAAPRACKGATATAAPVDEPSLSEEETLLDEPVHGAGMEEGVGGAVMTGFYFHPCSEPFQQLSLRHVVGSGGSGWEFR